MLKNVKCCINLQCSVSMLPATNQRPSQKSALPWAAVVNSLSCEIWPTSLCQKPQSQMESLTRVPTVLAAQNKLLDSDNVHISKNRQTQPETCRNVTRKKRKKEKRRKKEKKKRVKKRNVRLKVCRREEPPSASSKQSTHLVIKVAGVSVTLSCSPALAPPKAASFPPFTLG